MEKTTKELKSISKFIGFLGLYQVYNLISYFNSLADIDLSAMDAVNQQMMPVVKALSAAPFVVSILVHLFLCIKGHREANDPSPAKAHIVIAVIWMIGAVLSAISAIGSVFDGVTVLGILNVLFNIASTVLFFFYVKFAKEIRTVE